MRRIFLLLALLAGAAVFIYQQRVDLVVWLAPKIADLRDPIAAHREIEWPQGPAVATTPPDKRPPNIILILADDMGFNDLSFYNGGAADGTLQTPHIDAIAKNGVAFRRGYAANAVCAPSRAAIMTGRYSTRFGFEYTPFFKIGITLTEWMSAQSDGGLKPIVRKDLIDEVPDMRSLGMPPEEITIAELLHQAGYYTAHIGKWHLGSIGAMRPENQGFDNSLYLNGLAYLPEHSPDVVNSKQPFDPIDRMVWANTRYAASFDGGDLFEPEGYLTDYYTQEALKVIEANRHRPFFLYLAHWAIHNPLQAKRADYEALDSIEPHRLRVYGGMIRALDRGVGQVMAALEAHGLTENTLVIFTSDNGGAGYLGLPDINKPYRGWKLTHFEGGTHVPFFAQWPKRIAAGTFFEEPISHIDLFATIAAAVGVPLPSDRPIDGVNLLPHLTAKHKPLPQRPLFWRQGDLQTVLNDGWKLIRSVHPEYQKKTWLFNLSQDPTEQHNLTTSHPEMITKMEALLAEHNARQAPSLWPGVLDAPVMIDKTSADAYEDGDEFSYWPN